MKPKIRVLVVDDSSVVRKLLTELLPSTGEIEVIGAAPDPYVAREMLIQLKPDVITLDVEMPRMDGITFLEKVMTYFPTPTIIVSSLTPKGSETSLRALEVGAVAVVAKPQLDIRQGLQQVIGEIIDNVRVASRANVDVLSTKPKDRKTHAPATTRALAKTTHQLLAIGSSTGGTEALKRILPSLPSNIPGTIIVQHMPPVFTTTFAAKLNDLVPFEVREAKNGDRLHPGLALLAPGNYHVTVKRDGAFYTVQLNQDPLVNNVRPSADVLFLSVAEWVGSNAIGVILTGMGKDGALGLKKMKDAGASNIAQSEKSCVIYGMPREAVNIGAIDKIVDLDKIADTLCLEFDKRSTA